ncbi:MAG: hypothetical protein C0501_18950 [Isosphaera sp.]|nr:hypothetical protein [Isosphaera sp.]
MRSRCVVLAALACVVGLPLSAADPPPEIIPESEHAAAIAKGAPAADPGGKTKVPGFGELPNTFTNGLGMRFVLIPPGTFTMGCPADQKNASTSHGDTTPHEVTLTRPFYLARTELTAGEYALRKPADRKKDDRHAQAGVNYFDSVDDLLRLSGAEGRRYRLPTEAEWEYAARAGTTTAFYFGPDRTRMREFEWYDGHDLTAGVRFGDRSRPVALKKPNPWGLYDMLGNNIEYTATWAGDYPAGPVTDPLCPAAPDYAKVQTSVHVKRSGGYRYGGQACYSRMIKGTDGWRNGRIGCRLAIGAADLEPARDAAAFAATVRKDRVANLLAGTMDNVHNVRRHLAAGKVAGGWDLDWDQAAEYLGKATELDPKGKDVRAAIDGYVVFLDDVEKAVADNNPRATEAVGKARTAVKAIKAGTGK